MVRMLKAALASGLLATGAQAETALFDTPQVALETFIGSLQLQDHEALMSVFGPDAEEVLSTGDPEEDAAHRAIILALFEEGYRFRSDENGVTLLLGAEGWPFPVPLVDTGNGWSFDLEAGAEEIADREVRLNELDVIDMLEAYVELQAAFRLEDHDGDGVMEFASHIISDPGTQNGLFRPEGPSFVGAILARAEMFGFSDGETDHDPEPFSGYFFTILHEQGENAPGGAMSYLAGDHLVSGHAMLAVPADYGVSGVHTFMVGENGIVYEADFGEETLERAESLTSYDPGSDWTVVE